jgi:hypothetical protein
MRWTSWKPKLSVLLTALTWPWAIPGAHAQSTSSLHSLGGYGASASSPMASMGSTSPMIPYAGSFGGFMPYRMAGGSSGPLSFTARGNSVQEPTRTSFRLSQMSSGMGVGSGSGSGLLAPWGTQSTMRPGSGLMGQPMRGSTNTSVMPPNFGYPFYRPPSLISPASPGTGMTM